VEGAREQPAAGAPAPRDRVQDLHRPARPRQLHSPQALRQQRRAQGAVRGGRLDRGARRHHLPQGTRTSPSPSCLCLLDSRPRPRALPSRRTNPHVHDSSALDLLHCFALPLHAALRCVASTGRQLQHVRSDNPKLVFRHIQLFRKLPMPFWLSSETRGAPSSCFLCTWLRDMAKHSITYVDHSPQDAAASDESYRVPTPVTDPSSVASSPAYFSQYIHRKTK
jgi:hypothetical protein